MCVPVPWKQTYRPEFAYVLLGIHVSTLCRCMGGGIMCVCMCRREGSARKAKAILRKLDLAPAEATLMQTSIFWSVFLSKPKTHKTHQMF